MKLHDAPFIRRAELHDAPFIRRAELHNAPFIRRAKLHNAPFIRRAKLHDAPFLRRAKLHDAPFITGFAPPPKLDCLLSGIKRTGMAVLLAMARRHACRAALPCKVS